MQRNITLATLMGSGIIIGLSVNIVDHLMRFLLVGQIPATNIVLPPAVMLTIFSILALGIILSIAPRPRFKDSTPKSQLPKRRYSHI